MCVDGVPYTTFAQLQSRGYFQDFRPVARMVTCFPSLSSVGWAEVLDLGPEPGYQSVYVSNRLNQTLGVSTDEMAGVRFETRMHVRSEGLIEHALMYAFPISTTRRTMENLTEELEDWSGGSTAFAYVVETDVICHMEGRGEIEESLRTLDAQIEQIQRAHQRRFGTRLQVVLVSDHGHTLTEGRVVDLADHLADHGFRKSDRLYQPRDVVFTSAGILGSVSLHAHELEEEEIARVASQLQGVELACYDKGWMRQFVVSRTGRAVFEHDPARDAYRYHVLSGTDPLGYVAVFDQLRQAGRITSDGYAYSRDIANATSDHEFPDAPSRIRHGLNDLVRNPGNVLVSLSDGYENADDFVKWAAMLRGRSGTHGALSQRSSAGIFTTNYWTPPATIRAADVRHYVDLSEYHANVPDVEMTIDHAAANPTTLSVRDDAHDDLAARGLATRHVVNVWKVGLFRDSRVMRLQIRADGMIRNGSVFSSPLPGLAAQLERNEKYLIEVRTERLSGTTVTTSQEHTMSFTYTGAFQRAD